MRPRVQTVRACLKGLIAWFWIWKLELYCWLLVRQECAYIQWTIWACRILESFSKDLSAGSTWVARTSIAHEAVLEGKWLPKTWEAGNYARLAHATSTARNKSLISYSYFVLCSSFLPRHVYKLFHRCFCLPFVGYFIILILLPIFFFFFIKILVLLLVLVLLL